MIWRYEKMRRSVEVNVGITWKIEIFNERRIFPTVRLRERISIH